jgi:RNA polymerase sigma-70 factor (ECF subfamily)
MLQALHLHRLSSATPEERILQSEVDRSIWAAVDNLDDKHRIPVILRYVHEFNVPEIARILDLNQGTVHSRLHYARQTLHIQLGHLNPRMEVPDESSK